MAVWHEKQEILAARSLDPNGRMRWLVTLTSRAVGAVQSALAVGGCGRKIFVLAMCPLQFTKAGSAATLPQQKKNNSADLLRNGFIPRGDALSTSLSRSR